MAAAFTGAAAANVRMDFYDVRTSFLIVLVFGTVVSIVIFVLGCENMLPVTLFVCINYCFLNFKFFNYFSLWYDIYKIIFLDILWVPFLIVLSSISAIEETKYSYFSSVINQGAFAFAAVNIDYYYYF